jgi:hypothetical protein
MQRAKGIGVLFGAMMLLGSEPSWALLIDKSSSDWPNDPLELRYFYPYPTTYRGVDEGFAFDDDPLKAAVDQPYTMPVKVRRVTVRHSMVLPRRNFVKEMFRSAESI